MRFSKAFKVLQNLSNAPVRPVDIATALGVSRSNINYKRDKDVELTDSDIKKLEDFFNISFSIPKQYKTAYEILEKTEKSMPEDCILLDYYPDVFGSCGGGSFVFSEQKEIIQVPRRCFQTFSNFKKYSVINAIGDSMTPYIVDHDKLIVEHWNGEQIRDNRIYIFRFGDNIFIKRLVLNIDQIIVKSDNKEYPVRHIEKEDMKEFEIIGRIVGIWREEK